MSKIGAAFIDESRRCLRGQYLPWIRRCLEEVGDEDLWWRPNPHSNSLGNLLLHMEGNVRQWVVSGIGGAPDVRLRHREFDRQGGIGKDEVLASLEATLLEVDQVLGELDPEVLLSRRRVQGRDVTVLGALYHAVEHFATHTGQVLYVTKLRTGRDLALYPLDREGFPRPAW